MGSRIYEIVASCQLIGEQFMSLDLNGECCGNADQRPATYNWESFNLVRLWNDRCQEVRQEDLGDAHPYLRRLLALRQDFKGVAKGKYSISSGDMR
jgi:hypothetical protein